MPLWPSQLLADPGLGLGLVAGHAGLDARGPIRWAHIADTPDPTPWLEGGEVLLTTGLGVRDDPALQRRLIDRLAARGVVAVGFGVGVVVDEVPPALAAACDEVELPLFTVPYEVPFIAVTRRVSQHVFDEHYATLRAAVALHRQVLAAVVGDQGIDGVLSTVGQAMPSAALLAFDFAGLPIARHDPRGLLDDLDPASIWACLDRDRPRSRGAVGGLTVTGGQVRLSDEVAGVVVLLTEEALLEHEELLFEQGLTGVSLELARGRSVRDAHRARLDEIFEEVTAGRTTAGLVERQLVRLGFTAGRPFRVLALHRPASVSPRALCTVVEDAVLDGGPPLVGHLDGVIHALVPADDAAAERIVAAVAARGWAGVRVGRSRQKSELEALRAALREAGVARALGTGPVTDVDDLGLTGLLAGIRDDLGAEDFVASVLGPVLEHDARDDSRLLDTLRAYLAHGCRPGPAAEELAVHRHTLAYRLERIRDLTGRDPRSGDHLLEFSLALQLHGRPSAGSDSAVGPASGATSVP